MYYKVDCNFHLKLRPVKFLALDTLVNEDDSRTSFNRNVTWGLGEIVITVKLGRGGDGGGGVQQAS